TATNTPTFTNTPTATKTFTPTQTRTFTPTGVPACGQQPAGSMLPVIANWFSSAVRGLLAMAPPPQAAPPPGAPCVGVPQGVVNTSGNGANDLMCAPCVFDASKLCSYVDLDGDGNPDPGPLPLNYRGWDDPQADPTPGSVLTKTVYVTYQRADIYSGYT